MTFLLPLVRKQQTHMIWVGGGFLGLKHLLSPIFSVKTPPAKHITHPMDVMHHIGVFLLPFFFVHHICIRIHRLCITNSFHVISAISVPLDNLSYCAWKMSSICIYCCCQGAPHCPVSWQHDLDL